jgi:hypothetical protein
MEGNHWKAMLGVVPRAGTGNEKSRAMEEKHKLSAASFVTRNGALAKPKKGTRYPEAAEFPSHCRDSNLDVSS